MIQNYKLNLFGKDVLSIIESYDPEGFDTWSNRIKNVNKEYHKLYDSDVRDRLKHKTNSFFFCANYRNLTNLDYSRKIYTLFNKDTGCMLNKNY